MTYQEFIQVFQKGLQDALPEGACAQRTQVTKNNGVRHEVVVIHAMGVSQSPVIYLRELYERYCSGEDIGEIITQIRCLYGEGRFSAGCAVEMLSRWPAVRGKVVRRLINRAKNCELLAQVPHRCFLDLAVVYYCVLESTGDRAAAMLVRCEHLQTWGIDADALEEAASANMPRLKPVRLVSIPEILSELSGQPFSSDYERIRLYVLSCTDQSYGAVWMTDTRVLRAIATGYGEDYYILPSSVHEVIVVPVSDSPDERALKAMVEEINREHVADEEVLGDSVYRYDCETNVLRIAAQ